MELRIKELLKEKGVMHKELAERLGVTDIALRASLKGNPTIGTLDNHKGRITICGKYPRFYLLV